VLKTAVTPNPEIDATIRRLVDALSAFDGMASLGSCGGHPEPLEGGQWPEGGCRWPSRSAATRTAGALLCSWPGWSGTSTRGPRPACCSTRTPYPPYLTTPGSMLNFALED